MLRRMRCGSWWGLWGDSELGSRLRGNDGDFGWDSWDYVLVVGVHSLRLEQFRLGVLRLTVLLGIGGDFGVR